MAYRVFLDANICISFLLQRTGFETSERVFEKVVSGDCKAFTTPAVIHIISYFLKKVHPVETVKMLVINLLANV